MNKFIELLCLAYLFNVTIGLSFKYKNSEIDKILNNQRLYKRFYDCLANTGKCPPDELELRVLIPEALASDCAKCNDKQKMSVDKVLKFMIEKKPDDFSVLEKIYDPQGAYRKKYEAGAAKQGMK